MNEPFDLRRIDLASDAGPRRLLYQSLSGLVALKGVDASAHLRTLPTQADLDALGPATATALTQLYAEPYSTRAERDCEAEIPSRRGTRTDVGKATMMMIGLLTMAQCSLGARGDAYDKLVRAYFADRPMMPSAGADLRKRADRWRTARKELPLFESAETTRHAVLCVLRLYVRATSPRAARTEMRTLKSRILSDANLADRDDLSEAVLLAATDFTHHTDAQIDRTFQKLKEAKLKPRQARATFMVLIQGAAEETSDVLGDVFEEFTFRS